MVPAERSDVVHRVLEVDAIATLAPPEVPDVVDAALPDRDREQVGALQREVGGVIRPEAAAGGHDLLESAGVVVDERNDLIEYPVLVGQVAASSLFEREALVDPRRSVEAVDAEDLEASVVDQTRQDPDQPVVLVVEAAALLGREHEEGAS